MLLILLIRYERIIFFEDLCFFQDKSGKISADELKEIIGQELPDVDETVWEGLIKEIDINGDGEIDFEEFNKMMNNSTQNTELFEEK